jgi:hypothetical protein
MAALRSMCVLLLAAGCRAFTLAPAVHGRGGLRGCPAAAMARPAGPALRPAGARARALGAGGALGVRMQDPAPGESPGGGDGGAAGRRAWREPKLPAESRGAKRRSTLLEQAAAADLDQAELELKLESLKGELQAINKKMIATLRRRRKLLKQNPSVKGAAVKGREGGSQRIGTAQLAASADFALAEENMDADDVETEDIPQPFTANIDTFCTAEEYDMDVAFRRLRVWSRGNAKFMESGTVVHVRTGVRAPPCMPAGGADGSEPVGGVRTLLRMHRPACRRAEDGACRHAVYCLVRGGAWRTGSRACERACPLAP